MHRAFLVATHNAGKLKEYSEILGSLGIDFFSLADMGIKLEVDETGITFKENAILKSATYARESGLITLAEDSGLEVDALAGEPGIFTARYGGQGLTSEQRYMYLLGKLSNLSIEERKARFRCVIAICNPNGGLYGTASGICEGAIAKEPRGIGGFGYDPVFLLPEYGLTMAQLDPSDKHAISHRGRALKAIEPLVQQILS
ncbi:MAG: RdgB/HAM1 family non-canonical purine NTP pyrophosphatase [Candidatus Promineifilaceae bacterium]|nr:RdgB/HAM1 family non-canonical purine NTP pyrophosphatase [Candidatus Promineifilaceae bacterium]